ncbi:hypothetical protein Tco_1492119 [Tanacetum coccineum]
MAKLGCHDQYFQKVVLFVVDVEIGQNQELVFVDLFVISPKKNGKWTRNAHVLEQIFFSTSDSFSSSVSAGYIIEFMLEDLEAVPADYVPAGHVLISADRYRIC